MKSLLNRLDKEVFVLDLKSPLTKPVNVADIHITQVDNTTLEVELKKDQLLNTLFESLSIQGVEVSSMKNKANRLEELFLSLVEKTQAGS